MCAHYKKEKLTKFDVSIFMLFAALGFFLTNPGECEHKVVDLFRNNNLNSGFFFPNHGKYFSQKIFELGFKIKDVLGVLSFHEVSAFNPARAI